jgi:hypothetical protein
MLLKDNYIVHKCSLIYYSILGLVVSYADEAGDAAGEATRAGGNLRATRARYLAGLIGFHAALGPLLKISS